MIQYSQKSETAACLPGRYRMKLIQDNPDNVTRADVAVGIATCRDGTSLSRSLEQVDRDLSAHYPGRSMVMICCNSRSDEATRQAFMATRTRSPKIYLTTGNGDTGRASDLLLLLEKAVELTPEAVVALNAERLTSTHHLIRNLCEPLFQSYHFVVPLYVHRKYAGPFTSNVAYPLIRALYGRRVRQPLGEELGFSGRMVRIWHEAGRRWPGGFGTRIWMTTTAMQRKVAVMQSFMGSPKEEGFAEFSESVEDELRGILQTIFELMCRHEEFWKQVKWSKPTAVFGVGSGFEDTAPQVHLDTEWLRAKVSQRLTKYRELCRTILDPENFESLDRLLTEWREDTCFSAELWAKIVYDAAVAFKRSQEYREDLLNALLILYYAKTLWFVMETRAMSAQEVEGYIENQCVVFEQIKPYLLCRWLRH